MREIDVEDMKKATYELNNIEPFNEKMTFYYDESGNCRKFRLTEKGFNNINATKGDFVLAGVAYVGNSFTIDIDGLHKIFNYKEDQNEIKFKHLYRKSNNFLSFIGNKRCTDFLKWLDNSGLFIHYSAVNNLFYSLADIVDSLWETNPVDPNSYWNIKSALYDFMVDHHEELLGFLIKHTYPNVGDVPHFCNEFCELIEEYNNENEYYPGFFLEMLRQMLKTAGKHNKMCFITDNAPYILISEYYLFYLERCELFSNSYHIFDEELAVQDKFSEIQLYDSGRELNNWKFVKSNDNIYIQLSDIVAGLLRKLFMFLDGNSIEKICIMKSTLKEIQVGNFAILWSLIAKSESKSRLLIKNANTPKNVMDRSAKLKVLGNCYN